MVNQVTSPSFSDHHVHRHGRRRSKMAGRTLLWGRVQYYVLRLKANLQDHWFQQYNLFVVDLESRISAVAAVEPSAEIIQGLAAEVAALSRRLSDVLGTLPSYDQRQHEQVRQLIVFQPENRSNSLTSA